MDSVVQSTTVCPWRYWAEVAVLTSENLAPFSSGAPAPLICWPSQAAVHTTQPLTYVHLVTDAMPLAEDVENELEALLYTYASDQVSFTRSDDGACSVSLALVPRQEQQFVTATLNLAIKPGYPVASPDVDVRDAKGLDDAHLQQLLHLLQAEDAQLSGELRLGHLCEVALSYMDDNNRPEGVCMFCLNSFDCPSSQNGPLLRLPCYHAFHRVCFSRWWAWQQHTLAAQEAELVQHTGQHGAAALIQERLPAKEGPGMYACSCPLCRQAAPLRSLQQQGLETGDPIATTAATLVPVPGHQGSVEHVQYVPSSNERQLQARRAALFAAQQAKGGIIDTERSYSISAWSGPASAIEADAPDAGTTEHVAVSQGKQSRDSTSSSDRQGPHGRGQGQQHGQEGGQSGRQGQGQQRRRQDTAQAGHRSCGPGGNKIPARGIGELHGVHEPTAFTSGGQKGMRSAALQPTSMSSNATAAAAASGRHGENDRPPASSAQGRGQHHGDLGVHQHVSYNQPQPGVSNRAPTGALSAEHACMHDNARRQAADAPGGTLTASASGMHASTTLHADLAGRQADRQQLHNHRQRSQRVQVRGGAGGMSGGTQHAALSETDGREAVAAVGDTHVVHSISGAGDSQGKQQLQHPQQRQCQEGVDGPQQRNVCQETGGGQARHTDAQGGSSMLAVPTLGGYRPAGQHPGAAANSLQKHGRNELGQALGCQQRKGRGQGQGQGQGRGERQLEVRPEPQADGTSSRGPSGRPHSARVQQGAGQGPCEGDGSGTSAQSSRLSATATGAHHTEGNTSSRVSAATSGRAQGSSTPTGAPSSSGPGNGLQGSRQAQGQNSSASRHVHARNAGPGRAGLNSGRGAAGLDAAPAGSASEVRLAVSKVL